MNDTPRTDDAEYKSVEEPVTCMGFVDAEFARVLERHLNAANELISNLQERIQWLISERDIARMQADKKVSLREEFRELLGTDDIEQGVGLVRGLQERIKRLEEAGDALAKTQTHDLRETINWNKAKESK